MANSRYVITVENDSEESNFMVRIKTERNMPDLYIGQVLNLKSWQITHLEDAIINSKSMNEYSRYIEKNKYINLENCIYVKSFYMEGKTCYITLSDDNN